MAAITNTGRGPCPKEYSSIGRPRTELPMTMAAPEGVARDGGWRDGIGGLSGTLEQPHVNKAHSTITLLIMRRLSRLRYP
jgi:hypothetical protein